MAAALTGSDVPATGLAGKQVVLKNAEIEDLRASLRGQLLVPGQEGYDAARKVWNGAFNKKPALIARCAGAADVAQAVKFARAHELLVAVRGGGHSMSGHSVCDGGLMIDLSPMKSIRVDPATKTARLEPGVLLGEFDREAQAFGLATTAGTVSHTGAAGLTLGGGFGRIGRRFGLACDNLIAADVITSNGQLIKAGSQGDADLLWGLRGGGGNFGIVTSFEYQLHDVNPTMYGGDLVFPFAQARALLRDFADVMSRASDDFYADAMIVPTPQGQRAVVFNVCHSGTQAAAEKEVAALRKLGKPLVDDIKPATYVDLQSRGDASFPHGRGYYVKSGFIESISPQLAEAIIGYLETQPLQTGVASFAHHGGAIGRVKRDSTAFWHREANHSVLMISFWDKPADGPRCSEWVKRSWPAIEPHTNGFYVNDVTLEDTERRVHATYGENAPRLRALKKKYDPANVFRLNANIKPA